MRELKFRVFQKREKKMYEVFSFCTGFIKIIVGIGTASKVPIDLFEPIMQYTGLKDRNGKDIYEDDILKTPSGIGFVVFDNCGYAIKSPGSDAVDYEFSAYYLGCEIIGNIYENPELLTL